MKTKAPATHKKVIVEVSAGQPLSGYINPRNFDREDGLEMLDAEGQLLHIPWKKIKIAWFVRDWTDPLPRPESWTFPRRPRMQGIWVRLRFRDERLLDGVLVNDLLQLSPHGYLISPPELNGSHHKAFVPRAALASAEVMSVSPNRGAERRRRPVIPVPGQPRLFEP